MDQGIITGGADGMIHYWDYQMSIEKSINLKSPEYAHLKIKSTKIRSLQENKSR